MEDGKNITVLLVYGSGGHNAQMKRLLTNLQSMDDSNILYFISFCDNDVKDILTDKKYLVPSVTDKFSFFKLLLRLPFKTFQNIKVLYRVKSENNIKAVISTGPGISIVTLLYFKLFSKARLIHIETWSRFYSKSFAGRFNYYLADEFYVQNKELKNLYPRSIYKGRL